MTGKDYVILATVLKECVEYGRNPPLEVSWSTESMVDHVVNRITYSLSRSYINFDVKKFLDAVYTD